MELFLENAKRRCIGISDLYTVDDSIYKIIDQSTNFDPDFYSIERNKNVVTLSSAPFTYNGEMLYIDNTLNDNDYGRYLIVDPPYIENIKDQYENIDIRYFKEVDTTPVQYGHVVWLGD
jgi:hypothetical protein